MAIEVHRADNGSYEMRSATGEIVVIDGSPLQGLTIESAGAYLYAMGLLAAMESAAADPKLRTAIRQALTPGRVGIATSTNDVMATVRMMLPDLEVGSDALRLVVLKVAGECGRRLAD